MVYYITNIGVGMQFGDGRRYPDETFHFVEGPQPGFEELVVDPESLSPVYPWAETLEGRSAIATCVSETGESSTHYRGGEVVVFPGQRVEGIQTGNGEASFEWDEDDNLTYFFDEEAACEKYVPVEGDVFILKPNGTDDTERRVHPTTEPLPELQGSWTIEAVISADNRLVVWGEPGHQQLIEQCLALQLMETTADYINLDRSIGNISLIGFFSGNKVVQAYFKELQRRTGADFTPQEEVDGRRENLGIELNITDELRARYFSQE